MSSIPKLLKLKDYVTLIGTTSGLIALICATIGSREWLSMGFFLVTVAVGTDMMDGYIARKTGTVNQIGKELDSLSDSMTFGICPAILTFQAYKTGTAYDIILLIGVVCFALGGILRLARFNISESHGYTGVPTPMSALLLITFFYTNYFLAFALGGGMLAGGLTYPFWEPVYYITPFLCILIGWTNITTYITFEEKGKKQYYMAAFFAPFTVVLAIIGIMNPGFVLSIVAFIFFISVFLLSMIYVLSGFYTKYKKGKEKKEPVLAD